MTTRTAQIGNLRLVASPLPENSWLVRFHPDDGPAYDRMIVVSESDDGRTLHLSGWIGDPFNVPWREASNALFPGVQNVEFERKQGDGTLSRRALPLGGANRNVFG